MPDVAKRREISVRHFNPTSQFYPQGMASFRQLEQRHVSAEVSLLEWNPALDLIALGTGTGEVLLHRLSWQRVWTLPPPPQDAAPAPYSLTALAWRPDGKILAYAHDNGELIYLPLTFTIYVLKH